MTNSMRQQAWSFSRLFMLNFIKSSSDNLLDLVFPPRCSHCGTVDSAWCAKCQAMLSQQPIEQHITPISSRFKVLSTGLHTGILQSAVQGLKYHSLRHLAQPLGVRLSLCLQQTDWTFDTVMAVPLHTLRQQQRGYNQAKELMTIIAAEIPSEILSEGLARTRNTRSQVGLDAQERRENMNAAFVADPAIIKDRCILIVDDVCTTGATMSACAEALYEAGANRVYGLSVTLAVH